MSVRKFRATAIIASLPVGVASAFMDAGRYMRRTSGLCPIPEHGAVTLPRVRTWPTTRTRILLSMTLACAVAACAMNSNADSSGNFGPGGTASQGKAPDDYNNTGNYDPQNPPAAGFQSNIGGGGGGGR